MTNSIVLLMTRFPQAGKAKTRLIPVYGAQEACALHMAMTEFTVRECCALNVPVHVHYTTPESVAESVTSVHSSFSAAVADVPADMLMKRWLGAHAVAGVLSEPVFFPQVSGDLGARMCAAMEQSLVYEMSQFDISQHDMSQGNAQNCPSRRMKLIIIGSDCPANRRENMRKAFALLNSYDCVVGPSTDGGYYLIGFAVTVHCAGGTPAPLLPSALKSVFQHISWGGERVFAQTLEKIRCAKLSHALLPVLSDVDEPVDVPQKISLIIPTLNEAANIERLLTTLPPAFRVEVIVVDAHSDDGTLDIARDCGIGAVCLSSAKGRSVQMAAGAAQATGDILFFLHADSFLPPAWDSHIRAALADGAVSLAYFRFALVEPFWTRRIIEWATRARCALFRLPYGDQGLCVRRTDFERWNLPEVPIFEDVFLVKRARRSGRLCGIDASLFTSGRRWFQHGFVRTTLINISVHVCVWLGMNLEDIKKAYWAGKNPLVAFCKKFFSRRTGAQRGK